ncbi:hypothetical protein PACTADRAFT_43306 [Pachysolen tannophilus NRRL Y-2460]|uniref:CAAX prenyl protease n=1 Tax=Pachysolen tannophilus NRRL Y-2460 TaxID=669874 RepID=A0A1E4TSM1_PACTA|nr:hypothetical protein PACTADRAFT_43306 [Pachysolen tannophilus NRRL Y-2460]
MGSFIQSITSFFEIPGFNWKLLILGFTAANFVFDSYLSLRQIKHLKATHDKVPVELQEKIDAKTALKSQDYSLSKLKFSMFSGIYSLIQDVLVMKYDILPIVWSKSFEIMIKFNEKLPLFNFMSGSITQSLIFFGQFGLLRLLLSLPISYYQNFVLEEKFGFNKLTFKLWITDMLKEIAVSVILGFPFLAIFLKIIDYFGDNFMFYASSFLFIFQIFIVIVYPKFIQPLFNKLTPLENGDLKSSIEKLAADNKFPLDKLYVIDGSKRSSHSNAYFLGLPWGPKQIVIYDTLIEHSSVPETTAVLGHEIGHWALSHTTKMLLISQVHTFAILTLFAGFVKNNSLYQSFGFYKDQPILIGFILFGDILSPLDAFITFLMNLLSRKYEYQADEYSVNLGYAKELSNALIILHKENLSSMSVDWLYSAYQYNHPHLTERLRAINKLVANEKKQE